MWFRVENSWYRRSDVWQVLVKQASPTEWYVQAFVRDRAAELTLTTSLVTYGEAEIIAQSFLLGE
jgi:hypothetical protein